MAALAAPAARFGATLILRLKRRLMIVLQIGVGLALWLVTVVAWINGGLPFYTWYGKDVSRVEFKGLVVIVSLFIAAHITAYRLRRGIFR